MRLEEDFEKLGITQGDIVLMHSSFKSLGHVEGGIEALIDALHNVLTDSGTLIVPTFSYAYVTKDNPVFDARRTASNVGAITNYVRKLPNAHRSLSPTHSAAAIGKYAQELTQGQMQDNTPVGAHSPFNRLPRYDGKILFLGCGTCCNTSIHGVEELVTPEYLFMDDMYDFTVIDNEGKANDIKCKRHKFYDAGKNYLQRYDRVIDFLDQHEKSNSRVAQADCWLLDAKAVWEKAEKALRENPLCLVDIELHT